MKLCPYPFMAVCAKTTGSVVPCCHTKKQDIDTANFYFGEQSFEEIFYGEKWTDLRQQFLNGQQPELCNVCWSKEDAGLTSQRQNALSRLEYDTNNPKITFADIKFTNECNLSCRMCAPGSSNQIDKLVSNNVTPEHLWGHKNAVFPISKFQPEQKVQSTKQLLDNGLETLKVTGGEPFVSKYFHEVLDYAIEIGAAKNLKIQLTTNATKFTKTLLAKLENFKWIDYVISIDGYDKTYEYIRHPFKWSILDERINDFLNFYKNKSNFSARPEMLLMVYNALDYDDLNSWWEEKRKTNNILSPLSVTPHVKTQGDELAVKILPKHIKQKINGDEDVKAYVNAYYDFYSTDALKRLKQTINFYDKHYGRKYKDHLHPDIVEFIDKL